MSFSTDHIPDLVHIGFSEIEARVYLALLDEYPSTGYQLSKQAGIPRSMVYETLGRLHARGAVLRTDNQKTTRYQPISPKTLLDRNKNEHERVLQRLAVGLEEIYAAKNEGGAWSLRGKNSVIAFANQMIREAKTEIMLVLPDSAVQVLREQIAEAYNRGIQTSSLLTGSAELSGCGRLAHHPPLESELQGLKTMIVIVADQEKCLIANTETDMKATITTDPHLVLISRQFIWMELFTQRVHSRLGESLLGALEPEDRQILEGFSHYEE
ncbi:MAG: TrmB family transcriptional regulator [Anaerolineales bacterium]|nr:TrmB family transcriptional regulator [Anaerolineales bacterium]